MSQQSAHDSLAPKDVVRGQSRGYREEPGVAATSTVETFVAVRLAIATEAIVTSDLDQACIDTIRFLAVGS